MACTSIICVLMLFGATYCSASLPEDVTACDTRLPRNQFNKCILEQVKILTPHVVKGARSLNLPALDPFRIPSLFIDRQLDSLKVKANLRNVQVFGGMHYNILELDADPQHLTANMKIHFPRVEVSGEYDLQGRLLLLPLTGVGTFKGNFTDVMVYVEASGDEVTDKKGIRRVELTNLVVKTRVDGGKILLKSTRGSQALAADAVTAFFNGNPRLVLDIASPIIDDTAAAVAKGLASRALTTLTKDEILPYKSK